MTPEKEPNTLNSQPEKSYLRQETERIQKLLFELVVGPDALIYQDKQKLIAFIQESVLVSMRKAREKDDLYH